MKSRLMLGSVMLAAMIVAGCGGKPEGTSKPAGTDAPAQQQASAPASTAGTASSVTKYAVVTDGSTASYSVRERLLRKELDGTAVGRTSALTGEIILEDGVIKPSVIQVDLSTLKSDENRRDNRVRLALDTANHPFATYQITGAEGNPVLKEGQEVTLKLQGNMTIKGTEKPLVFNARAKLEGDTLTLTAETTFKMTEFGVTPPNMAGFVSVTDDVKLDVTYVGRKQ